MLLYHDPSSTSIDECGSPRAADDVRHAPRIEMRNPVAGGHDSGVGAEHIDVHRGPLPLWILHVAADVSPERLDLLLESGTGDGDVAAAGRVDGPLLGVQAHHPLDGVWPAQIVRVRRQCSERVDNRHTLGGSDSATTGVLAGGRR